MDYFKLFNLEPLLNLDLGYLEKQFYELSRRHHPDYHTNLPKDEQEEALRMTALLNDAYRTLKNPTRRAEYLLDSRGFSVDRSKVPESLLMEVFEINEGLEQLREAKQSGSNLVDLLRGLENVRAKIAHKRQAYDKELSETFCRWDALVSNGASTEDRREHLTTLCDIICRASYIRNLERDIEDEVES